MSNQRLAFSDWLKKAFGGWQRKAASVITRFAPRWKRWEFAKISFNKLVDEGYRINSAVSACVTTLAFSFPEPPLLAGTEVDGRFVADYRHELMELIRRPNPDMGEVELMQFAVTYASTGGNCYFYKLRNQRRRVVALYPFSDGQFEPIPGERTTEGFVKHYEYDAGDGQKLEIPKEDVIQWKWGIDPLNPARGIGAIELCAREVDKDNEATKYIYSLLRNNAVPPVVITLEEDDDPTQEEIDAMGQKWVVKHSQGQPAFITAGMKVEKMGFDLNQLAAESLNAVPESRIAANFRIPPVVAGLSIGLKRSDYGDQAARRSFTELTLAALWRSLASELYNGLKDDFDLPSNFNLQFDLRKVRALQEEETKVWERVTNAFNRSVLTRAEAKQYMGLMPKPGDDVYFVSLASEFVPAGEAVVRDPTPSPSPNSGKTPRFGEGSKSIEKARLLQRIRLGVEKRMAAAVDVYFSQLSARVEERAKGSPSTALRSAQGGASTTANASAQREIKADLPSVDDLFKADDWGKLETLVKRFYIEIVELSWETWNYVLGVEAAFDLTDPAVTRVLGMAGTHIREIKQTVLDEVRAVLQYGSDNGWGVDLLVRGDESQRGLRAIIDETYKNQARAIARSELGQAQNVATAERYKAAGVRAVEILDGGSDDSAPACQLANGMIWSVKNFEAHPLQHPNCTRAAAPYFGDEEPVTSWAYAFGDRG